MDRRDRLAGFTLIELLIVISIIALLAVVLLPEIVGSKEAANEAATQADMIRLDTGAKTFGNKRGYFPPDDLKSPEGGAAATWKPDNGQNTGIESLVAFVSQSQQDGIDLSGMGEKLTNTDKDDHGAELPMLHTKERKEVSDPWGTPLCYFSKFGMEKTQSVTVGDQDPMPVKAHKNANGTFRGAGKFQILSAGRDMIFGTGDDLCWPDN